jgi:hypothetical protein
MGNLNTPPPGLPRLFLCPDQLESLARAGRAVERVRTAFAGAEGLYGIMCQRDCSTVKGDSRIFADTKIGTFPRFGLVVVVHQIPPVMKNRC